MGCRGRALAKGQTEETFVRDILGPELALSSIFADVHKITTGRKKGFVYRGGFVAYDHLRKDLMLWMKQERQNSGVRFTTMVDLYRLPQDFPGITESKAMADPIKRAELLEAKLAEDVGDPRLIPYIQLHEFESLLFSAPKAFSAAFPDSSQAIENLTKVRDAFASPEHIDDGAETAPSKRICQIFPGYVKTSYGLTIAKSIGLATMRHECSHFNSWIEKLLAA